MAAAKRKSNLLGKDYSKKHNTDTVQTQDKHIKKYKTFEQAELPESSTESISSDKLEDSLTPKRINMAFSDPNYDQLVAFAKENGATIVQLVNTIIEDSKPDELDSYISSLPFKRGKYSFRQKGHPLKRINLKFTGQNHKTIMEGAQKHQTTITQYVNMTVEVFFQNQDKHSIDTI